MNSLIKIPVTGFFSLQVFFGIKIRLFVTFPIMTLLQKKQRNFSKKKNPHTIVDESNHDTLGLLSGSEKKLPVSMVTRHDSFNTLFPGAASEQGERDRM